MAKINLPFTETGMTPSQVTPNYNEQDLNQAQNEVLGARQDLLNSAMSQAEMWKGKSERAEMMAVEAENKANLMKLIPDAMKDIGGIIDETSNKILSLDIHQFKEELKQKERAYVLDSGMKLQEDYLKFRQTNPGNPKAALEFVNSKINQSLSQAPSETSKLDFLSKAYGLKYSALSSAYAEKRHIEKNQRMSTIGNSYQSVLSQIKMNPLDTYKPIQQMSDISKVLAGEGKDQAFIDRFNIQAKSDIMSTQVRTFLDKGDPKTAIKALATPAYKENIAAPQYKTLEDLSVQMFADSKLASYKGADIRAGISALRSGAMTPEMPKAKQYADADFMLNLKTMMPASSSITESNVGDISNNLIMYWKGQPIVGADQTKFIMDRVKYSNNPYEVAGYAMALDRIYNEKELQLGNVAGQYKDIDEKYTGMALDIARVAKLGNDKGSLQKSVEEIRKFYFDKSKDEIKDFNKSITQLEKDGGINYNDVVSDTFNHWYSTNPTNTDQIAKETREIFLGAYIRTGSVDAAKDLTKAALVRDYQTTTINGSKEIMKNAPEQFIGNAKLAQKQLHDTLGTYFKEAGLEYSDYMVKLPDGSKTQIKVQPLDTGRNDPGMRRYLVTDLNGGLIQKPDGTFLTFDVKFDQDRFDKERIRVLKEQGLEPDVSDHQILDSAKEEAYTYLKGQSTLEMVGRNKPGSSFTPKRT